MFEIRKEVLCDEERIVVKKTTPHSGFHLVKNGQSVLTVDLNSRNETLPKEQQRKPLKFFAAKGLSVLGTTMAELKKWQIKNVLLSSGDLFLDTQIGRCKVVFY